MHIYVYLHLYTYCISHLCVDLCWCITTCPIILRHTESPHGGWMGFHLMELCVSISSEIINLSIISRGLITKHPSKFSLVFSHSVMLDSVPNLRPQRESTSNTWSDSPPRRSKQHKGEEQFGVKGWCVSLTHLPHGTEMPTLLSTINIQRCECILRLLAAAGDNGDCFLMDTRQSKAGWRDIVGTSMPHGKWHQITLWCMWGWKRPANSWCLQTKIVVRFLKIVP